MLQDVQNLRLILRVVAFFEPDYDFRPVLDEWSRESVKELRFDREGRITRRVERAIRRAGVDVGVPEIIDLQCWVNGRLTGMDRPGPLMPFAVSNYPDVFGDAYDGGDPDGFAEGSDAPRTTLVMKFVRGFKLGDEDSLKKHGADSERDDLMRSVVEAFAVQQLLLGTFTGDPHPGNIMLEPMSLEDGSTRVRPVLLDFGLAKTLDKSMRVAFARLVTAAADGDAGHLLDAFDEIGVKLNREQPTEDLILVTYLLRDVAPPTQARARVLAHRKWIMEQRKKRMENKQKRLPVDSFPGGLLFYLRTSEILHGVGSRLGSSLPYLGTMAGFARLSLRAQTLGISTTELLGVPLQPKSDAFLETMREALKALTGTSHVGMYHADARLGALDKLSKGDVIVDDEAASLASMGRLLSPPPPRTTDEAVTSVKGLPSGVSATPRLLRSIVSRTASGYLENESGDDESSVRSTSFPGPLLLPQCLEQTRPFHGRLEARVHNLLTELFLNGDIIGAQVAVYRRGRLIVDVAGGELGSHDTRRVTSDALFNVFSVSKGVMCSCLHRALDHTPPEQVGLFRTASVGYDWPIRAVWKDFGGDNAVEKYLSSDDPRAAKRLRKRIEWKRSLSLFHVLTHGAGLAHALPSGMSLEKLSDCEAMETFLASVDENALPMHSPGAHTSYHYYNFGWAVSGVLRRLVKDGAPQTLVSQLMSAVDDSRRASWDVEGARSWRASDELFLGLPSSIDYASPRLTKLAVGTSFLSGGSGGSAIMDRLVGTEESEEDASSDEEETAEALAGKDLKALVSAVKSIKGREYLLDPRVMNREGIRRSQIPAANVHASARALAALYASLLESLRPHCPSPVISRDRLLGAITSQKPRSSVGAGAAFMAGGTASAASMTQAWGLGYQLWETEHGNVFGHAGIGGSLALASPHLDLAVAVTVNRLDSSLLATKQFLRLISKETGLRAGMWTDDA
jgi:CubicO group peptidase (beta-lactamase class C family)